MRLNDSFLPPHNLHLFCWVLSVFALIKLFLWHYFVMLLKEIQFLFWSFLGMATAKSSNVQPFMFVSWNIPIVFFPCLSARICCFSVVVMWTLLLLTAVITWVNFWDEAWWFLSLRVFGLLSLSLLAFPMTIKMKTIVRKPLMIKICCYYIFFFLFVSSLNLWILQSSQTSILASPLAPS